MVERIYVSSGNEANQWEFCIFIDDDVSYAMRKAVLDTLIEHHYKLDISRVKGEHKE